MSDAPGWPVGGWPVVRLAGWLYVYMCVPMYFSFYFYHVITRENEKDGWMDGLNHVFSIKIKTNICQPRIEPSVHLPVHLPVHLSACPPVCPPGFSSNSKNQLGESLIFTHFHSLTPSLVFTHSLSHICVCVSRMYDCSSFFIIHLFIYRTIGR